MFCSKLSFVWSHRNKAAKLSKYLMIESSVMRERYTKNGINKNVNNLNDVKGKAQCDPFLFFQFFFCYSKILPVLVVNDSGDGILFSIGRHKAILCGVFKCFQKKCMMNMHRIHNYFPHLSTSTFPCALISRIFHFLVVFLFLRLTMSSRFFSRSASVFSESNQMRLHN